MDYLLTEKDLMFPIIIPLFFEIMVIIETQRCRFPQRKWVFALAWYLFGIIVECFLYLYHFDIFLCYIWILEVMAVYPIFYFFAKLGDLINKDLTLEEQQRYYDFLRIKSRMIGICILFFVCFEKFNLIIYKNLDNKTVFFSKFLYLLLGVSCVLSSVVLKKDYSI